MDPTKIVDEEEHSISHKTGKLQQQESENYDLLDEYEETLPDMMKAVEEVNLLNSKKLPKNRDKALYMKSFAEDMKYLEKRYESFLELCKNDNISIYIKSTQTTADLQNYSVNKDDGRKILVAKRSSSKTKNCQMIQGEGYTLQTMKDTLQGMKNTTDQYEENIQDFTYKVKGDFDLDYRVPVKRMRRSTNKAISISNYYEKLMDFTGPNEEKTDSDESPVIKEETECVPTMEYNKLIITNMIRRKFKIINELNNTFIELDKKMELLGSCQ